MLFRTKLPESVGNSLLLNYCVEQFSIFHSNPMKLLQNVKNSECHQQIDFLSENVFMSFCVNHDRIHECFLD